MQPYLAIFATVFLAELGDKTQIATLLFSADGGYRPIAVFLAASLALTASTACAVLLGTAADRYLSALPLKAIAGAGFIAIGAWMLWEWSRSV
jgi:putative Ca2+/H+ antiporter (TMEM165/GDT1 family)